MNHQIYYNNNPHFPFRWWIPRDCHFQTKENDTSFVEWWFVPLKPHLPLFGLHYTPWWFKLLSGLSYQHQTGQAHLNTDFLWNLIFNNAISKFIIKFISIVIPWNDPCYSQVSYSLENNPFLTLSPHRLDIWQLGMLNKNACMLQKQDPLRLLDKHQAQN